MDPKKIYNYYISNKFNPIMPAMASFRHYRVRQANGKWRKVPIKISKVDDLKKWIVKLGGCDIYYSTSCWLNPHKVSAKGLSGSYHIADNLILNNDLAFDIDVEHYTLKDLKKAQKVALQIYNAMEQYKPKYTFHYIAFTGCKGFRLVYLDNGIMPDNARYRLDYIEQKRKVFIDRLLKYLEEVTSQTEYNTITKLLDTKITINPMCVIRVLGTVHSKTGFTSCKINPSWLYKSTKELLNHIPHINGEKRPGIPACRKMTTTNESSRSPDYKMGKDVTGLASLPDHPETHTYYFSNRVLGVKRGFIPILIYQDNQTYYKKEILKLQQEYKLGPLYVFHSKDKIIVISLKTMQKRQLQKLLNKSKSRTRYDFIKYNRIFAPFWMGKYEKIPYKYIGHLSRGHFIYLNPDNKELKGDFCGWPQIELIRADRHGN